MPSHTNIPLNSLRAWVLAARPKTLSGAAMPVVVALVLAATSSLGGDVSHVAVLGARTSSPAFTGNAAEIPLGESLSPLGESPHGAWVPAILCLLFALTMQVLANFVNDYFDFRSGVDDEHRLGPRRACAQGWVTPRAMRRAIGLTAACACVVGLPLVVYGGWAMVAVGAACLLMCFFYTLGGARHALGDILVVLGFGIIPVCVTFYLQLHSVPLHVWLQGLACGLVVDTLLVVNNYRDYPTDLRCGKRTLVVRLGRRRTEWLYLLLPVAAWVITLPAYIAQQRWAVVVLPLPYIYMHWRTYRRMKAIGSGKALNAILGENSRNMLLYGLLTCIGLLL